MSNPRFLFTTAALLCLFAGVADAQDQAAAGDVAQANNPLANFTAFNLHNYYIGELTDPDKDANQFWARFAKPFSIGPTNWLMRASLPVNTFPVAPDFDHQTGLGDLNVFAAYLIDTGNPALSGPLDSCTRCSTRVRPRSSTAICCPGRRASRALTTATM